MLRALCTSPQTKKDRPMTFELKERNCPIDKEIRGKAIIAATTQEVINARQHYNDMLTLETFLKSQNKDGKKQGLVHVVNRAKNQALDMWLDARDKAEKLGASTNE